MRMLVNDIVDYARGKAYGSSKAFTGGLFKIRYELEAFKVH
jgi:hypothetical protein